MLIEHQAELSETIRRPALIDVVVDPASPEHLVVRAVRFRARPGSGWLTHDQPPTNDEEGRTAFGCRRGRAEGPSHDRVERPPQVLPPAGLLSPRTHDSHPLLASQLGDCALEERATALRRVEQHSSCVCPMEREHQTRNAPATAEIEKAAGRGGQTNGVSERMVDVDAQGAGPEKPQAPAPLENSLEGGIEVVGPHRTRPLGDRRISPAG